MQVADARGNRGNSENRIIERILGRDGKLLFGGERGLVAVGLNRAVIGKDSGDSLIGYGRTSNRRWRGGGLSGCLSGNRADYR